MGTLAVINVEDSLKALNVSQWGKSLTFLSEFVYEKFSNYVGSEGSGRLESQGRRFFHESYLRSISVGFIENNKIIVKARCFPSQRKNEAARPVYFIYDGKCVTSARCACLAGNAACTHSAALAYAIAHYASMGFKDVPEDATCTSKEMIWHKPRGNKSIDPEAIMEVTFARVKPNRKRRPIVASLLSLKKKCIPTKEAVDKLKKKLQESGTDNPMRCLIVKDKEEFKVVDIPLGPVVKGSVLHHQMRHFKLKKRAGVVTTADPQVNFPKLPIRLTTCGPPIPSIPDAPNISVTLQEAQNRECSTRGQVLDKCWFAGRKNKCNSSCFGIICKRKKAVDDKCVLSIIKPQNLDHIEAVRYGRENEATAKEVYIVHMSEKGKSVQVLPCGNIINPAQPHATTSPDGRVIDMTENNAPHGLIEVKCLFCGNNRKYQDLAMALNDRSFWCYTDEGGQFRLKRTDNRYYQVQAQIVLSGLQWCDFVVYDGKRVSVERIWFDEDFCKDMLKKVHTFYYTYLVPYFIKNSLPETSNANG